MMSLDSCFIQALIPVYPRCGAIVSEPHFDRAMVRNIVFPVIYHLSVSGMSKVHLLIFPDPARGAGNRVWLKVDKCSFSGQWLTCSIELSIGQPVALNMWYTRPVCFCNPGNALAPCP